MSNGPESENLVDLIIEDTGWSEALPGLEALADTAARLALEAADLDPDHWSLCIRCNCRGGGASRSGIHWAMWLLRFRQQAVKLKTAQFP